MSRDRLGPVVSRALPTNLEVRPEGRHYAATTLRRRNRQWIPWASNAGGGGSGVRGASNLSSVGQSAASYDAPVVAANRPNHSNRQRHNLKRLRAKNRRPLRPYTLRVL